MKNDIKCKYSLLNEGRTYTGNHRKYIIENARDVCYSPATREKIKLHEAFGYYGHGRRILAGGVELSEVGVVTLPDGTQAMVSHVPSNVTTQFDIEKDGSVTHTQNLLETETGNIIHALNRSKVGGFSWVLNGHTAKDKTTTVTGFAGFDYVLQPGFSDNRGYVIESANGGLDNLLFESVSKALGATNERTKGLIAGWKHNAFEYQIEHLETMLFESGAAQADLQNHAINLEKDILSAHKDKNSALSDLEHEKAKLKGIFEGLQESLPIFIPQDIMHELMNGDFSRAKIIFESANLIDFSQFPLKNCLSQNRSQVVGKQGRDTSSPEWGSADYGFGIDFGNG